MKKLLIVGAGISGLSAGVYAARSGFDVTILEQHFTFGGLSTSWSRKGYYFEGGMHWLTGSKDGLPMNKVWHELGALRDNNPIENRDPLYTLLDGDKNLSLRRYEPDMRKALLEYAPEDAKMINKMCNDVKAFSKFYMPVFDYKGCKCKNPEKVNIFEMMKMLPAIIRVPRLAKMSYMDYVNQFKNKNVRRVLESVIGYRYNALSFVYTLGSFASGDCGYPHGGSVQMAKNIADKFEEFGGKIQYRTKVEKVVIENGVVKGVKAKIGAGANAEVQFIPADAVIVSQDARAAIDNLFEESLKSSAVDSIRENAVGEQNMFVCLGIKADLIKYPYTSVLPIEKPFEFAGLKFNEIRINNYAKYKDHAPEGCTAMTCLLIGDSYDYWKAAKADGTYKAKKDELAQKLIDEVSKFIPEIKDNVEVIDVATPCTYERYCGSDGGSWMSVWLPGQKQFNYEPKLADIDGLYFAGQRIRMPGGLPLAAFTARMAVQNLCKDTNTLFI